MSSLDRFPEPLAVDMARAIVLDRIDVASITVPDEVRALSPRFPFVGPALMLVPVGPGVPPIPYMIPRDQLGSADAVLGLWRDCVATLFDDELMHRHADAAHTANASIGLVAGPEVRCPGCNSKLFGVVAVRGGCLACYPDLRPLEQAAELGEETHR